MKENDWFLTSLNNIEGGYTNSDYKQIGITANNTEMLLMSDYAKLDEVKNNELFLTNGKFDLLKFENFYYHTLQTYNDLALDTSIEDAMKSVVFFRDDILAPVERRIQGPQYNYVKVNNPDRVTAGIIRMDKWEDPELTPMEIAESLPIFDPETGTFTEDTPETSFFKNFFKPMVLASWDEDGFHEDPDTGELVQHKKGELKINPETGTYYAEYLNGRNAYEKLVVRKLDILTAEGSLLNKFDFFDSDGFEKSVTGTIAKNAVMIAPLLVGGPVAATWVVANLGLSLIGLGATINKMILGSDHEPTNELEGILTSLQSNVSVESQESLWTAENLINMAGHTFEFLYNMQFIHQKAPALFKGKTLTEANMKEMQLAAYTNIVKLYSTAGNLANNANLQVAAMKQAEMLVLNYAKNYQALGRHLSTAFMATTFGAATYNEAKAAGATDTEASLMTLASMGMQFGLLKSHIGNWIFPDAKFDALRRDLAIRVLASVGGKEGGSVAAKESNVKWMLKIFKETLKVLKENYNPTAAGIKGAAAMATAAGVEMTSFEVMHDISGTLFNFALELNGKKLAKDPMNILEGEIAGFHPWENMSDRYLSSFIGGAMGGLGLKPWMPFKEARNIKQMTVEDAHRYVIHLIKEGKIDLFVDRVESLKLGDTNLSAKKVSNLEGEVFEVGTATDNQDVSKKLGIKNLIEIYTNALKENGGIISDSQLLNAQIMGEVRFGALLKSKTGRKYIELLNRIDTEIATKHKLILDHFSTKTKMEEGRADANKSEWQLDANAEVNKIKAEIKDLVKLKLDLLDGKTRFLSEAIFEMSPALHMSHGLPNFPDFASKLYQNKPFDSLTDVEKRDALLKYKDTMDINFERDLDKSYNAFINGVLMTAESIETASKELFNDLAYLYSAQNNRTENLQKSIETVGEEFAGVFYESGKHHLLLSAIAKNASKEEMTILKDAKNIATLSDLKVIDYLSIKFGGGTLADFVVNNLAKIGATEETIQSVVNSINSGQSKAEALAKVKSDITISTKVGNILLDFVSEQILENKYQEIIKDLSGANVNSQLKLEIVLSVWQLTLSDDVTNAFDYDLNAELPSVTEKGFLKFLDSLEITKGVKLKDLNRSITNQQNWETLTELLKFQLDTVIQAAEMYRSYIVAANKEGLGLANAFGFNIIYNKYTPKELKNDSKPLPEIDGHAALHLVSEMGYIIDHLQYHKTLIDSVQKAKTAQEDMIGIKTRGEIHKLHKHLLDKVKTLDSWNKEELIEFEQTLEKCEVLGKDALKLSNDLHKKYIEEHIAVDTALGKILSTKTEELLADLFRTFNLLDSSETMSSLNMDGIDIHTYVCYLAKISAIPSNAFYKAFKSKILPTLAPLPGLTESLYTVVAHMAQPEIFDKFINSYNNVVTEQFVEKSPEPDTAKKTFIAKNSKYYIRFNRLAIALGIPGAGKSRAIAVLAREFCPKEFNKRVAFVTVEDSKASMAQNFGITEDLVMTHDEFIKTILKDYSRKDSFTEDDIEIKDGVVKLKNDLVNETNPYTLIIVDEATHLADLEYHGVNDYATKYDTAVMLLGDTDQAGIEFNYKVNAFGEEMPAHSAIDKNNFVGSFKLGSSFRTSNNYMDQSIEAFRLFKNSKKDVVKSTGLSFHIDADKGLQGVLVNQDSKSDVVKLAIDSMIKALKPGEKIMYMYDKVHTTGSTLKDYLETFEHKDKVIIRPGTALGLESRFAIYENIQTAVIPENVDAYMSNIYTALSRAELGVILLLNGGAVKNKTIVSSPMSTPANPSVKSESIIANYAQKMANSLKDIDGPAIEFAVRKSSPSTPPGTAPGTTSSTSTTTATKGSTGSSEVRIDDLPDPNVNILVEKGGEVDIIEGDGTISEADIQGVIKVNQVKRSNPTFKKSTKKTVKPAEKSSNGDKAPDISKLVGVETCLAPIFTNAAHEDGLVKLPDGTYRKGNNSLHRIDGANGIVKLLGKSPILNSLLSKLANDVFDAATANKLLVLLERMSHICLNEVDHSRIHLKLESELGIEGVKGYYEFLSIPEWDKLKKYYSSEYLTGYRGSDELQYVIPEGSGKDAPKTARHALYYTVTDSEGNKLVRVALARIPNPDSFSTIFKVAINNALKNGQPMPYSRQFVDLLITIDDLHIAIDNESDPEKRRILRELLIKARELIEDYCIQNSNIDGFPTYAKLSYLFRYSSNSSFKEDNPNWTFASMYDSMGPMRAGSDKGSLYVGYDGLVYKATPTPLVEEYHKPDRTVSGIQVYVNKDNQVDTGILAGLPYVLIGPKNILESELRTAFIKQHQDSNVRREVSIKYLLRPTESVLYYTKYLRELMSGDSSVKKYTEYLLGNDLTAFKIFSKLLETPEGKELIQKGYDLIGRDLATLSIELLEGIVSEANGLKGVERILYMKQIITGTGTSSALSRALLLLGTLVDLMYADHKSVTGANPTTQLQQHTADFGAKLESLTSDIKVPYRVEVDKSTSNFHNVILQPSFVNAENEVRHFMFDSKVDSASYVGPIDHILDNAISKIRIRSTNNMKYSLDDKFYYGNTKSSKTPEPKTPELKVRVMSKNNVLEINDIIKSKLELNATLLEIILELNDNGHIAFDFKGEMFVLGDTSLSKDGKIVDFSILEEDIEKSRKFSITLLKSATKHASAEEFIYDAEIVVDTKGNISEVELRLRQDESKSLVDAIDFSQISKPTDLENAIYNYIADPSKLSEFGKAYNKLFGETIEALSVGETQELFVLRMFENVGESIDVKQLQRNVQMYYDSVVPRELLAIEISKDNSLLAVLAEVTDPVSKAILKTGGFLNSDGSVNLEKLRIEIIRHKLGLTTINKAIELRVLGVKEMLDIAENLLNSTKKEKRKDGCIPTLLFKF